MRTLMSKAEVKLALLLQRRKFGRNGPCRGLFVTVGSVTTQHLRDNDPHETKLQRSIAAINASRTRDYEAQVP